MQAKVADIASSTLSSTGVPSASIGIVKDGTIVYAKAFGNAHLSPNIPATSQMAYPIGSISKQFTAAAVLLLAQDGKLSLDDAVSRFFPELTDAGEITVRNLLTHTSGYQDDAPLDYIPPSLYRAAAPLDIVHTFAGKPLDFDPGTQWQYSNTGFILSALIIEKVSGKPLQTFLEERIFRPLGMTTVLNTYSQREKLKVTGYISNALAPLRELPLEAPGWYFGDGDLAMCTEDLLRWDLSLIGEKLLKPSSYKEMETTFHLKNGRDTHYGLGFYIGSESDHRELEHGGEVGGFVAENIILPDDNTAVVVLTNEVASGAATEIAHAITALLLPSKPTAAALVDPFSATLRTIVEGLQRGAIDRSLFSPNGNAYFTEDVLQDFKVGLDPRGAVISVKKGGEALRGGLRYVGYKVTFADGTSVSLPLFFTPDGKLEQLLVTKF